MWLLSRHFDLKTTYSEPAEELTDAASALLARELRTEGSVRKGEFLKIDRKLRGVLPDVDSFWFAWRRFGERRGWLK